MTNTLPNIKIRNYIDQDAEKIARFDFLHMLAYRYNGDFESANIFCAVDEKKQIYGIGHLEPDPTWFRLAEGNQPSELVYKINLNILLNPALGDSESVKSRLFAALLNRANELRSPYANKKVSIIQTIPSDETDEIDFYLSKGFITKRTQIVMKRDLKKPIPQYSMPKGLSVRNWKMETPEEEQQYLKAEAKGDLEGVSWSLNRLRWTKSGSEWDTFTAFFDTEVIGSVMTWGLGERRSATENIFVLPEWRRKGVAKAILTESLKFLKRQGKTEATLGIYGENKEAILLYKKLGYELMYTIVELEYRLS